MPPMPMFANQMAFAGPNSPRVINGGSPPTPGGPTYFRDPYAWDYANRPQANDLPGMNLPGDVMAPGDTSLPANPNSDYRDGYCAGLADCARRLPNAIAGSIYDFRSRAYQAGYNAGYSVACASAGASAGANPTNPTTPTSPTDHFAFIQIAPGYTVLLIPRRSGDDLFLDLLAETPAGQFQAQGRTTVQAWQNIMASGKAKFGPRLDRWFHFVMSQHGVAMAAQGQPIDLGDGSQMSANDVIDEHTAHTAGGGAAGFAFGYRYFPVFGPGWGGFGLPWNGWGRPPVIFPNTFYPPQDGFGYPLGLPTFPPNPTQWRSRAYQWAYPPFTSAWNAQGAFCPPGGGCGI